MVSVRRILITLVVFGLIFVGTGLLYGYDRDLALFFNLACFGIISAYIARNKGRSALGWFFIGFLGGVLGLAAVAMAKPASIDNDTVIT